MITEVTTHLTQLDAETEGKKLKEAWGYGYCPHYRVWQKDDVWVLRFTRWDSCD